MIDTHIHADARSGEDLKEMHLAGINTAISCSYYPYKIPHECILINHMNRILELDTLRAKEQGLNLKVALGIHPTNSYINPQKIYENIYNWIKNKEIVAIGEIGLEDLTNNEINVFEKQLDIACETKSKVIVHTPRKNKEKVLNIILDIIPQHIDEKQVVIDHINPETLQYVINTDCMIGLTVQPQKLTEQDAISILNEYGFDKFLLNSDSSNKASDILSVPKTINELKKQDYSTKDIQKIAHDNAAIFFNL